MSISDSPEQRRERQRRQAANRRAMSRTVKEARNRPGSGGAHARKERNTDMAEDIDIDHQKFRETPLKRIVRPVLPGEVDEELLNPPPPPGHAYVMMVERYGDPDRDGHLRMSTRLCL